MFHLLGDLRTHVNWGAGNSSYVERDSRIRLQGYDDFAELVEVKQPDGSVTEQVRRDYTDIVPLLRHRWEPENKAVQKILTRERDVRLTIDARLQARTAEILRKYATAAGRGEGAAAVILDPDTGDVLASVSYPFPDKGTVRTTEDGTKALIDRARYGIYPPGSTFKLVTAMAALRKDPAVARKTFQCVALQGGRVGNKVRGWGKPIRDDVQDTTPHGEVDLEKGIVESCNAYFAQLGTYEVGAGELLETAQLLGITTARPNTPAQLEDALPQASYGQGQVIATPFKMARVAATIARGGSMPQGQWIGDDSEPKKAEPVPVLSETSAAFLARTMREVVTEGTAARILGGLEPPVAGKTGTAEVLGKGSHSWFVGYAPYDLVQAREGGRRIAFAVIIEHGGYGGKLAAQATGEIVQAASALGLFKVEPKESERE